MHIFGAGPCSARCVRALAIDSKLESVIIEANVPPRDINKRCCKMKEKAEATSG